MIALTMLSIYPPSWPMCLDILSLKSRMTIPISQRDIVDTSLYQDPSNGSVIFPAIHFLT